MKIIKVRDIAIQLDREDAQDLAQELAGLRMKALIIEKFLDCLEEGLKGEVPF
jgi:hypothetical protein